MRKILKLLFIVLLVFIMFVILWQISKSRSFQFFGGIIQKVDTNEKVIALTFDDGPSKENTPAVLGILNKLDIPATFFVIGSELEKNFEEGKLIAQAGHELGNHTYSHNRMVLKSPAYIRQEIEKTDKLIKKTGYTEKIQFRPPFGKKLFYLPYYLNKHNIKTIMWDLEPETYPEVAASSTKITDYVVKNTKPGSIILLHVMYDNRKESIKSIEGIVTALQSKGYKFVTVSELLKYQNAN